MKSSPPLRGWDEALPGPTDLKSPPWMPSPDRNTCHESRSGCTICWVSTFPASLWAHRRETGLQGKLDARPYEGGAKLK